jgi:hypothetical protein
MAGLDVGGLVVEDEMLRHVGDGEGEILGETEWSANVGGLCLVCEQHGKEEENDERNIENMKQHNIRGHEEEEENATQGKEGCSMLDLNASMGVQYWATAHDV